MTNPERAAAAILADCLTRRGFPAFFASVEGQTQERIVEAWVKLIESAYAADD